MNKLGNNEVGQSTLYGMVVKFKYYTNRLFSFIFGIDYSQRINLSGKRKEFSILHENTGFHYILSLCLE